MEIITQYFLYFIIYGFIGWSLEVICKLAENKRFINRGFLLGPICPIYGVGVLLIITLIGSKTTDILSVFLKSILVCSTLEYIVSYLMEKMFKARWWDYTRRKFNINGRICLETMIPFGILGSIVIYIIHPIVKSITNLLPYKYKIITAIILFVIFVIDFIVSYVVMNKIKNEIKDRSKDNTEYIKEKIYEWLETKTFPYRRYKFAFPNMFIDVEKIKKAFKINK